MNMQFVVFKDNCQYDSHIVFENSDEFVLCIGNSNCFTVLRKDAKALSKAILIMFEAQEKLECLYDSVS